MTLEERVARACKRWGTTEKDLERIMGGYPLTRAPYMAARTRIVVEMARLEDVQAWRDDERMRARTRDWR